ncbi:MAG: hypothetical protein ACLPR9_04125 [Acidimicrobiales bacterium]
MKFPRASSVEVPTGDAVDTLLCQVPRSGSPVATENHVSATLEPLCPPEADLLGDEDGSEHVAPDPEVG